MKTRILLRFSRAGHAVIGLSPRLLHLSLRPAPHFSFLRVFVAF